MSTRRLAIAAFALLSALPVVAQTPLPPGSPTAVRTNQFQAFSPQYRPPSPLLPPTLFSPPRTSTGVMRPPSPTPVGVPAPLAVTATPATPATPVAPVAPSQPPTSLAWDAELKEYHAKVGDSMAHFTFYLTNVSTEVVSVNSVHTSCGCTVAQLPSQPWRLGPGTNGPINVTVNLAGKSGTVVKSVTVDSTAGVKSLLVKVHIPTATGGPIAGIDMNRMQNMQTALADRQAVFKGECAKCHVEPAKGLAGAPLYDKACGICHDSANRASTVPDLKHLTHPTSPEHWRTWIASGKVGSMMPAFAKAQGGPLDDAQIESLVKHLSATIPSALPANTVKPVAKFPTPTQSVQ